MNRQERIRSLEEELKVLKNEQAQEEKSAMKASLAKLSVGCSDDYAMLTVGTLDFYYGYEQTWCPFHGNDAACGCDEEIWCFVVTDGSDKDLYRLTRADIGIGTDDCVTDGLLYGIGFWMLLKKDNKPVDV